MDRDAQAIYESSLQQLKKEYDKLFNMLEHKEYNTIEEYNIILNAYCGVAVNIGQFEMSIAQMKARKEQLAKMQKEAEESKNE